MVDVNPEDTIYNYILTQWVGYTFVSLFGLATVLHLGLGLRARMWWALPTMMACALTESIGWSGRVWSSYDPLNSSAFQMQICTTIMAPTFLIASNFIILGKIINRLGPQYSRMSLRAYSILFLSCDIVALVIQAIGGAFASSADTLEAANQGGNIMLGGIAFQLAVISFYSIFAAEFMTRYFLRKPVHDRFQLKKASKPDVEKPFENHRGVLTRRLSIMLLVLLAEIVFLYVRSVYRTVELTDGWNGTIISTQVYFNVFDGAMMVLAVWLLIPFHPSFFLAEAVLASSNDDGSQCTVAELHST
ncbi:RTA1 like protein [Cylindrobasidium torrendii FP15055 ss-10]|uniref:RTA1 like protein n=1 Tax=Cylindrobasidium torrendii FP15055 ss-10 TaxID=1314674 RepID=A0A0D7B1H7_9AGAR|nr:RTA1 like protein [Cylindrobasidium torrendii FP15055 ss-10]